MNISNGDERTIERALEIAVRSVSIEDGKEFRQLLNKMREPDINKTALDGVRYDYTDNI